MGYVIKEYWQGRAPSLVRVYDPETKLQRDAFFETEGDAKEACAIMSRIITASTFEGTELIYEPD